MLEHEEDQLDHVVYVLVVYVVVAHVVKHRLRGTAEVVQEDLELFSVLVWEHGGRTLAERMNEPKQVVKHGLNLHSEVDVDFNAGVVEEVAHRLDDCADAVCDRARDVGESALGLLHVLNEQSQRVREVNLQLLQRTQFLCSFKKTTKGLSEEHLGECRDLVQLLKFSYPLREKDLGKHLLL